MDDERPSLREEVIGLVVFVAVPLAALGLIGALVSG